MSRFFLLFLISSVASIAMAIDFDTEFAKGKKLAENGELTEALRVFLDLQVEYPESELLQYALGCVHSMLADVSLKEKRVEEAQNHLEQAGKHFDQASKCPDTVIRRLSLFNKSNTIAKKAFQFEKENAYESAIETLKESIEHYERTLGSYQDFAEARQNLDHVSYRLKRLLQNPPAPVDRKADHNEKGNDQQKETEESSSQESKLRIPAPQSENELNQNNKQKDARNAESSKEESIPEKRPENEPDPSDQITDFEQSPFYENKETMSRPRTQEQPFASQSIESILESLEIVDQQEQKEQRALKVNERSPEKWW